VAVARGHNGDGIDGGYDGACREVEAFFYVSGCGIDQQHIVGELVGNQNLLRACRAFDDSEAGRDWNGHIRSTSYALGVIADVGDVVLLVTRGEMLQRHRDQPLGR
jgi:hypothetical protein